MVCPLCCDCRFPRLPAICGVFPSPTVIVQGSDGPAPGQRASPLYLPTLLCQTLAPYPNFLKAAHVNVQSLLCHIDEFRSIFHPSNFDFVLISETWLKPSVTSKSVELEGYNLFRNDREHKRGGGVAAFVKSYLPTSIIYSSDSSREGRPEYMFLDVTVNSVHVLVSVCYKPPDLSHLTLSEFENIFLDLMARYSHIFVMGDFNIDLLRPTSHDQTYLTTMFHSYNMTILPLQPTHHTSSTDTWLDVIAVSDPTHVAHHGQLPVPGLSKHDLIFVAYMLHAQKHKPKYITYRKYKDIDHAALLADAAALPWYEVTSACNANDMVIKFNSLLLNLYDFHAPIVTKRVSRAPAPWINEFIKILQGRRDSSFRKAKRSKSAHDWAVYKQLRNRTQQHIRNAKVRFYHSSLSKQQSTKALWNKIKNLGIGKSNENTPIPIDLNIINDYFINVPVDVSGALDYVTQLDSTSQCRVGHLFSFSPVTEADVLAAVMRMTSNAIGADIIPLRFLKDTLLITLPVITKIFNMSLFSSTFPEVWKFALVRPIKKSSNPKNPSDFRPISILPCLSKCLERVVHQQFSHYLHVNNILTKFQSGFRPNHSTTTTLLKVTDDIRLAMDRRQATILILFDFSKAFDCVYHPLLLIKLKKYGFSDGCVDWVGSYLTGRRQCVREGNCSSTWKTVTRGVPQGSVLGPLLFSLYIDDITTVIGHSQFHLYADDLQIYKHFKPNEIDSCVELMNIDIESIVFWAHQHGLKLNENKTQSIMIGHPRLINKLDLRNALKLKLNDHELEYQDKVKNLGLTINKYLGWTDHVTAACNRVFAGIHCLKHFALYLPYKVKVMLVKTLVLPHFNYCDVVINDVTVELSDRLQRAQNYCIRFIFNLRRFEHVTPFFHRLSIMKLHHLRNFHTLSILHTIVNTKTPVYLSDKFYFMSEISERPTRRGASLLAIPIHRSTAFNRSFTVRACRLWNSLPDYIRTTEDHARFGALVKGLLLRDP